MEGTLTDAPTQAPTAPAAEGTSFADLSKQLVQREAEWRGARETEASGLKAIAESLNPKYEAVARSAADLVREGREKIARVEAAKPTLPAPPNIKLTDFLAPVAGESPEASIAKLIQAAGLFATGLGSIGRGRGRAGLAALTGALTGWREGDKDRAERAMVKYKAETEQALSQWEIERKSYQDWFNNGKLSLDMQVRGAEMEALMRGNEQAVNAFRSGSLEKSLGFLQEQQRHADSVALRVAQLAESQRKHAEDIAERKRAHEAMEAQRKADSEARAAEADARRVQADRHHAELMALRREKLADAQNVGKVNPEDVEGAAQMYADGAPMPPLGQGRYGTEARLAVMRRAAEIRQERGDTQGSMALKQAVYRASAQELARVQAQRGLVMSFAYNFDRNLNNALALSEKVDRTGVPVFNRWLLAGRKEVAGDPDVAAFNAAVLTVTNEYAKIAGGSTAGSDSSRHEAAQMINTAMTSKQFRAVADTLKQDTHNREKGYDDQIAVVKKSLGWATPDVTPPKPEPAKAEPSKPTAGKTMRIRKKGTTQVYEGPAGSKIPDGWEEVEGVQ